MFTVVWADPPCVNDWCMKEKQKEKMMALPLRHGLKSTQP
jgi:hypothetical protein